MSAQQALEAKKQITKEFNNHLLLFKMYLTQQDLEKAIKPETLLTWARNGANIEQAIVEAIEEVESYLTARYDMATEFQKTSDDENGDSRVKMVVKLVREIALYNCVKISNPTSIHDARTKSYDDSISFLRSVQKEKTTITGLTRKNTQNGETTSNFITFNCNPKRPQHI